MKVDILVPKGTVTTNKVYNEHIVLDTSMSEFDCVFSKQPPVLPV